MRFMTEWKLMSKPERSTDSLFLAARTGDLGGVDVIFSFATFDNKESNQSSANDRFRSGQSFSAQYFVLLQLLLLIEVMAICVLPLALACAHVRILLPEVAFCACLVVRFAFIVAFGL